MPSHPAADRPQYDVIVVLGADLRAGGIPSRNLHNRVMHGVELFQSGKEDRLLVTGGRGRHGITEADAMRALAVTAGVPEEHIIVEPSAQSTFENAVYTARLMGERGWTTALVVSDSIHLRRALFAFRYADIQATGSAADGSNPGLSGRSLWSRIADGAYEWLALLVYMVRIAVKPPRP